MGRAGNLSTMHHARVSESEIFLLAFTYYSQQIFQLEA